MKFVSYNHTPGLDRFPKRQRLWMWQSAHQRLMKEDQEYRARVWRFTWQRVRFLVWSAFPLVALSLAAYVPIVRYLDGMSEVLPASPFRNLLVPMILSGWPWFLLYFLAPLLLVIFWGSARYCLVMWQTLKTAQEAQEFMNERVGKALREQTQ